jgi:catechol 2,3-dioxygenase-like lactoylglutathione lyase family enzyme
LPNLENLKKQAKRYVRWHREGRHPVAAVLRQSLPKFAGMTDAAIMAEPFRLADAQALVAHQAGYPDWAALLKGETQMPQSNGRRSYPSVPILINAEPMVFVTDFPRALDFYERRLGFKVALTFGEPPFFGQVVRDGATIAIRRVDQPVIDRSRNKDLLSASMMVTNAKKLFTEFEARGVPFHQTLRSEPWHGPAEGDFIVADPDGNLLMFGGRTD